MKPIWAGKEIKSSAVVTEISDNFLVSSGLGGTLRIVLY